MSGINLHAVVRSHITAIHPDETVTLYQSNGQTNEKGRIIAAYADPISVIAQVQSVGTSDMTQADNLTSNTQQLRFYMYADASANLLPDTLNRPLTRTGDMIKRSDNTYWLITSNQDNFTRVGWVCVIGTLQELPPAGITDND